MSSCKGLQGLIKDALVNHAIDSVFTGKYYRMTELLKDINLAEFNGGIEMRSREKSLILCSQMSSVEWHKKLGGGAILDRAYSKYYQFIFKR